MEHRDSGRVVEVCDRLIKQHERTLRRGGAGDCQPGSLTARESAAASAKACVEPVGEARHEVVETRDAQRVEQV